MTKFADQRLSIVSQVIFETTNDESFAGISIFVFFWVPVFEFYIP